MKHALIASMALVAATLSALPIQAEEDPYRQGYYWGNGWITDDEADEEKEPEHKELPPLPDGQTLLAMHPDQLRALEKERMDYALWKQTPEAVKDYYTVITAIRKKARTFAALASYNSMTDIKLNTNPDLPVSNQGVKIKRQQRESEIAGKLNEYSDQFALVTFTSKSCSYCEAARSANRIYQSRHHWDIKEVDIDQNPQLAAKHDIQFTPTTIVIRRGYRETMPIAFGAESVPALEENAYRAIRLMLGEITPQEFFTTQDQKGRSLDPKAEF